MTEPAMYFFFLGIYGMIILFISPVVLGGMLLNKLGIIDLDSYSDKKKQITHQERMNAMPQQVEYEE